MDGNRVALATEMNDRRLALRIRWVEVAARARMDAANLRRIRRGEIAVTEDAAYGIEIALGWTHGSVLAVLGGGRPTLAENEETALTEKQRTLLDAYRYYREDHDPDEAKRLLRRDLERVIEMSEHHPVN